MRLLAALCGLLAATTLYLWRRGPTVVRVPVPIPAPAPALAPPTPSSPRSALAAAPGRAAAVLGAVAQVVAGRSRADGADEAPPAEGRRERRQQWLRDTFGRAEGETDEAWRARVMPMVELMLARPRQRVEDRRAEFEAAAELTPEQRAELDKTVGEARAELVAVADKAIGAGDLTPYRRNTAGILRFVGVAAGVADGLDARLREALSAEQAAILEQTGFDVIEYVGLTTPWESVSPPPPAPR